MEPFERKITESFSHQALSPGTLHSSQPNESFGSWQEPLSGVVS